MALKRAILVLVAFILVTEDGRSCQSATVNYDDVDGTSLVGKTLDFTTGAFPSYARLTGTLPSMDELSICVWIMMTECNTAEKDNVIVSYATSSYDNEILLSNVCKGKLFTFYALVGGPQKYCSAESLDFSEWSFLCIKWRKEPEEFSAYSNGNLISTSNCPVPGNDHSGPHVAGGGTMIFGLDQDSHRGGLKEKKAFSGYITEFNLWNRYISGEEILLLMMSTCGTGYNDAIVSWTRSDFVLTNLHTAGNLDEPLTVNCDPSSNFTNQMLHATVGDLSEADVGKLIDEDLDSCLSIPGGIGERFVIDLGGCHVVRYVVVNGKPSHGNVTVDASSSNSPGSLEDLNCGNKRSGGEWDGSIENITMVFFCNDSIARYVSIESDFEMICEVEVHSVFVCNCNNVTNETLPGTNYGQVWWRMPDFKSSVLENTINTLECDGQPGDMFPIGETNVNCWSVDNLGHRCTCTFTVLIIDTESPVISTPCCDKVVNVHGRAFPCANVSWEHPAAFDNSGKVMYDASAKPGDCFSRGTSEVTYNFTDPSGNQATCSFNVTVRGLEQCSVQLRHFNSVWRGNIRHGDVVEINCRPGWKPDQNQPIRCNDGELSGEMPSCIGKYDSFCPEDTDEFGISWPKTKVACTTDWQRCPKGTRGLIHRRCDSLGHWAPTDSAFCQSEILAEVIHAAPNITSTAEAIRLINTTEAFLSTQNVTIGGDLPIVVDILQQIDAADPLSSTDSIKTKLQYIEGYVKVANHLLAPNKARYWQNIHKEIGVQEGSVRVFKALQVFSDNVNDLMQIEDIDVHLKYENIEYRAYKPNKADMNMDALALHDEKRVHNNEIGDLTDDLVTELTLESGTHRRASDTSVFIAYVYHNSANVLPVNSKSSSKGQSSESNTKKTLAVNSPVVTIRAYNGSDVYRERESLLLKIPHNKVAYNPKCVTMNFNDPSRVWKTKECVFIKSKSTKDYTVCRCSEPTIAALVMTMTDKPQAFIVMARDGMITLANGLSFLLVTITSVLIILSGLDTEQYYLIRHYCISFLAMPFFVFLGGITHNTMYIHSHKGEIYLARSNDCSGR
ncbi:uncharacterized protein [Ptychodera flava]|uniref:uncharacterized protein n=1 Tax=Ptychodera flava TaxID=63121 RepID=UPI003969ED82